jgi:hypothetical protein
MVCRAPSEDDARILAKAVRARGDHRGLAAADDRGDQRSERQPGDGREDTTGGGQQPT